MVFDSEVAFSWSSYMARLLKHPRMYKAVTRMVWQVSTSQTLMAYGANVETQDLHGHQVVCVHLLEGAGAGVWV